MPSALLDSGPLPSTASYSAQDDELSQRRRLCADLERNLLLTPSAQATLARAGEEQEEGPSVSV